MIKIKSEILPLLNVWFDEYFSLANPFKKETLLFNIMKNYEFKVYQTYLTTKKQIKDLLTITQKTLIIAGVKCLDDDQTSKHDLILKGFKCLSKCYHLLKDSLSN